MLRCCFTIHYSLFTISLFHYSPKKVLITKYEVPEVLCFWWRASVRRWRCGGGHRTQPLAPSQGEGESLLVKGWLLNCRCMTIKFATHFVNPKGIPLSFGEGPGVRPRDKSNNQILRTPTHHQMQRPTGTSYFVICTFSGEW